ncbi:MAG TPA: hypothetical protein VHM89_00225 [Acidimicrobiales bacterium]|nr:hypothetical protein [Acidimicrobiales bacterium]
MTTTDIPGGDAGQALYGLSPEEFTAARNALAKHLRSEGERAEAALVAKLRRPPVTAWALNMVARERPDVIDSVMDAGKQLRAATDQALAGNASALRTAQAAERRAVDTATAVAAVHLLAGGQSSGDGPRQRMAGTLRAALVDPAVAAALRAGVLDDDREAPGFGLDAFSPSVAGSAARRRPSARSPAGRPGTATGAEGMGAGRPAPAAATVDAERAEAEAGRRAAERAKETGRRAAELRDAERRAAELRGAADDAERGADTARRAAARARSEAEAAAKHAADLEREAEAAIGRATAARTAAEEASGHADEVRRRAAAG